jgi:hypothetical protein
MPNANVGRCRVPRPLSSARQLEMSVGLGFTPVGPRSQDTPRHETAFRHFPRSPYESGHGIHLGRSPDEEAQ